MNTMFAVAIFPSIRPEDLAEFKMLAVEMLKSVKNQESVLRYEMFFNEDSTRCVILEEYADPSAVIEHVNRNSRTLDRLVKLGGPIEGSMYPRNGEGDAISQIRVSWESNVHDFFAGFNRGDSSD